MIEVGKIQNSALKALTNLHSSVGSSLHPVRQKIKSSSHLISSAWFGLSHSAHNRTACAEVLHPDYFFLASKDTENKPASYEITSS